MHPEYVKMTEEECLYKCLSVVQDQRFSFQNVLQLAPEGWSRHVEQDETTLAQYAILSALFLCAFL